MANSFTAGPGEMPYDPDAVDDPGPPWVCEHCGSFRHKPTCWRVTRLEKATRKPEKPHVATPEELYDRR